MSEDIYRQLAARLDAIPNGFPPTASGVELRLLAALFTPEEAALAAVMKLSSEPAAAIAARAGVEVQLARQTLKTMARKGLIRAGRGDGEMAYGLLPFVVGIYEAQLGRLDADAAALFEEYYRETGATFVNEKPSVHRVIPVGEAIPVNLEVFPYEHAAQLIENAQAWAVRDCICRVQKRLIGQGCHHPVQNCLSFAPVAGVFDHDPVARPLTKEEALRILGEAAEAGLVHTTGNYRDGVSYICNCCTCSCGVLRAVAEFDLPTAVARADFRAVVDDGECLGCGDCQERCQFGALSLGGDVCQVDEARCVGCGQCTTVCPSGALTLERRPESERESIPANLQAWMEQRARQRGIDMGDVL